MASSAGVPKTAVGLDIAGHTGLRADTGSGADPSVLDYTDLSAHDDTILDDDGPAESGLRCNDHALAEATVVSDVDQVVERCAAPDAGVSEDGPINRRVGADLYLVLQHDAPAVGHADQPIGSRVQSESIGTQHAARVEDAVRSHHRVWVEHHVRIEHTAWSDRAARHDHDACMERRGGVHKCGGLDRC